MTNHSLPADPNGAEGDSEKKKWGYKRQQFDAVISTTRFNGAIDKLVTGALEVRSLLAILDELNASNQRGRYMAEVLAFKQESRRLATVPFDPRVAEFLREGSRRIPMLSDGLASQMAVALASAADNLAYLDTVNTAVSNLLLDLDRPLKPDTRYYLRALTDKIDATRRLQEARGHLPTVPSVYPPGAPDPLAVAAKSPKPLSPEPPSVEPTNQDLAPLMDAVSGDDEATKQIEKKQVLAVGDTPAEYEEDYEEELDALEPTELKPSPKYTSQRTLMMPVSAVPPAKRSGDSGQHRISAQSGKTANYPALQQEASPTPAEAQTPRDDRAVLQGAVTVQADADQAPETLAGTGRVVAPPRPAEESHPAAVLETTQLSTPASPKKRVTDRPPITSHGPMPVPSRRPARFVTSRPQKPDTGTANTTSPGIGGTAEHPSDEQAPDRPAQDQSTLPEAVAGATAGHPAIDEVESLHIPTRRIPVWVMVTVAGGLIAAAASIWLLTRGPGAKSDTAASASASAAAVPSAAVTAKKARSKAAKVPGSAAPPVAEPPTTVAAPTPPPAPPPAPPAPPPTAAQPAAAAPPAAKVSPAPIVRTPAPPSKPVHVAAPSAAPKVVAQPAAPKAAPVKPEPTTEPAPPKPQATAAAPTVEPPAAPSTPKPSRTIDDILVELLQVPNDPASIESKAHEVARIVARSARPEAEHILQRLIPEEVLAGTETVDNRALEPVRRVVALLLKKVALDKDDNRAALAIDSLGEWAKLRKHGAAAKLTLDELAESPVVLSRPKRLHALERVQARLGISNVGE